MSCYTIVELFIIIGFLLVISIWKVIDQGFHYKFSPEFEYDALNSNSNFKFPIICRHYGPGDNNYFAICVSHIVW